ncbi:Pyruvate/Phosphoenolpyruvate kinase-like domain-containing protein [Mycena albidolilacea]|uniref:Pyruvate/Phosphoenolpyruvate kinase-like domain-containing protein n=1 Tax=Mycena albidolilacea TaxID=1033008 RepID=A0AAD6ZDA9_9AGAR|nr:Pyruvate/Phosphoenolpyruvate kinase-like domain-containing protein [Mycena albidolilacea]
MSGGASTLKFTVDPSTQASWGAPTRQQSSNMRGLIRSGKVLLGQVLSFPSRQVAKTLAVTGADWIWIDAEHVAWSQKLLVDVIQIINHESGGKMIPIVRVPSKTAFEYMAWCLDAGAGGIIIPHVETVEEIAAVAGACRFPPAGHRSYPPFTYLPGLTDATPEGESVFSLANKHVAIIPQIESRVGIQNIDSIMQMEEVDAVMIGAGDLRLDMGMSVGFVGEEPEFVAAMSRVTAMSKRYNKSLVGVAMGTFMLEERLKQGFTVLVNTIDLYALAFTTVTELGTARAAVEAYFDKSHSGAVHANGDV